MRANLDAQGNLLPPITLEAARLRLEQLRHEIDRITAQLADPARLVRLGESAYDEWHIAARGARRVLTKELKQLEVWVAERSPVEAIEESYEAFWREE